MVGMIAYHIVKEEPRICAGEGPASGREWGELGLGADTRIECRHTELLRTQTTGGCRVRARSLHRRTTQRSAEHTTRGRQEHRHLREGCVR